MAGMKGQPAPKPGQVASPVPGDDLGASFDKFLASSQSKIEGLDNSLTQAFDNFTSGGQAQPPPEAAQPESQIPQDQFAPEPGFVQANIDQLKPDNFITRLQAGLAANDTEKLNFLRKKYGADNAVIKDDKLYFRRDKSEKFKPLDPKTFEVISDILPDFAREMVTEAAMVPGEIAGATAGAVAGMGFGAPVTAPAGAIAGRVASVPLANAAADKVAQWAGVPQDESRNKTIENVVGMGLEGTLPFIGGKIARGIAKRVPGTEAYKIAKDAGEKEVVALTEQSKEVVRAANELQNSGVLKNIPGSDTPLMLHQVQPDSPEVANLLKNVANAPALLNAETKQSEAYGEALKNTLTEIARQGNKGPVSTENLASTVTNAVKDIDKLEGQAIGKFRAKALASLGNKKQVLPQETNDAVLGMMKELGFTPKNVTLKSYTRPGTIEGISLRGGVQVPNEVTRQVWTPPKDIQKVIGNLGLTSEGEVRAVSNVLNEYGQLLSRGGEARLTDVERLVNRMGPLTQRLQGTAAGAKLAQATSQLRQFRRQVIGSGLTDEFEKKAFNSSMDNFSMIRQSTDQLQNLLRNDVTAKTVVSGFFKGKENLANVRALKSITGEDSPQWGALKEEFVNQLLLKHASESKTGFNSKAMLDDLRKNYGDDFMNEVLGKKGGSGPNYETVKKLLMFGDRIEKTAQTIKADTATENQKKNLVNLAIGLAADVKFKAVNGITALLGGMSGEEKTLFEIMQRDGIEKYVKDYPGLTPKQRGFVARNLESMVAQYKFARDNGKAIKASEEIGKRSLRGIIKQDAQSATGQ